MNHYSVSIYWKTVQTMLLGAGNKKMDKLYSEGVSSLTGETNVDKHQCDRYGTVSGNKVLQRHNLLLHIKIS